MFLTGTSTRRLGDPITGGPGDQIMVHSRDVRGNVDQTCFLNSVHKQIKLLLTGYCIVNGGSKNVSEQYNG